MPEHASWAVRLGGDDFLAQVLHRSYALFPAQGSTPGTLLSWDDLNAVLATYRLEPPRLRLSQNGESIPAGRYTVPAANRRGVHWSRLQPALLHALLAEGASLVLDAIDEIHPPVRAAAAELERFFRTPVQTNVYASWTEQEGFGRHWDDHDVVVVQQYGAKRWRLWPPTRPVPAFRDVEFPPEPEGEPVADIVLRPGDVLYLPRGWWHSVTADQGVESLHLTFGLVAQTGASLLGWVTDELHCEEAIRADVPVHATATEQADYLERLRKSVLAVLSDPDLIDRWTRSTAATHPGRPMPSLPHVTALPQDREITVRLTAPRAELTADPDGTTLTLAAASTECDVAAGAEPVLQALLTGRSTTLGELADTTGLHLKDLAELLTVLIRSQMLAVVGTGQ
ncbi:cupin-like domain-containing protein [Kitasatospora sp. NA04385]|uniref:cupin domain-containing protein n=1 Tax=Kitasatospora sp. NA04385 TaxID=2742135 RepID=UPI0015901AFB|nr:cupin domain-containing protein [Kitasatospora sp. NA04385]QKW20575.1 cupin-like domain-containing protein [Kitasatospora sp. NA04385]